MGRIVLTSQGSLDHAFPRGSVCHLRMRYRKCSSGRDTCGWRSQFRGRERWSDMLRMRQPCRRHQVQWPLYSGNSDCPQNSWLCAMWKIQIRNRKNTTCAEIMFARVYREWMWIRIQDDWRGQVQGRRLCVQGQEPVQRRCWRHRAPVSPDCVRLINGHCKQIIFVGLYYIQVLCACSQFDLSTRAGLLVHWKCIAIHCQ